MANSWQSRATGPLFLLKTGCPNEILVASGQPLISSIVNVWDQIHYLQKISIDLNFRQKKCPLIKLSDIFKHPKILQYSKTKLVSQNKPDVMRKGLEMETQTRRSFQNSCCRLLSHFELQRSYMEQTLGETLLEILNYLTEFVLFCHRLSINI